MRVWVTGDWEELFQGVFRKIVAHNAQVMLMLVKIMPGAVVPMHSHLNLQAGVVLRGSLLFKTGTGERVLVAGNSYLLDPWENHEVKNIGEEEALALDVFHPAREDYAKSARPPDYEV
ncbi:MAG: cupin domain-containing protein [Nitrososphaerota archaeon]